MILVIIGIAIAIIVFSFMSTIDEFGAVGFTMLAVAIVVAAFLGSSVKGLSVLDDKIAMYEEQNDKIEEQIAEVVKQYMEYETGIFTEVTTDSAITLVALYPELKADALVASQIELYVENNEKIIELREEQINGAITRWWLYFGG